jgi:hypothetical protein
MIQISIVNQSTAFDSSNLPSLAQALQTQVTRDLSSSEWGKTAQISYTPPGENPIASNWVVGLFDDADVAGALGYHDITPSGMPLSKIFVKPTLADGSLVSVATSHEVLEMLIDPDINLAAELDDGANPPKFYAYEVADAVELDIDGYDVTLPTGNIRVSNFVLPSWFEGFRTTGPFDFMNLLTSPFSLRPGGYIGVLDLSNLASGWQQVVADGADEVTRLRARPHLGSRRMRRTIKRGNWVTSTYKPGMRAITV